MTTHVLGREYDIIFAGGGTAACVTAGRLAAADPGLSILLVEGGRNNHNDPVIVTPAAYLVNLQPDSQTALLYQAEPEETLNGRAPIVPAGGILGGGSSINFMMYTRAQGIDYDSWNTEGWDAASLIPLARKLETYHLDDPAVDKSLHGNHGPVHVSFGTYGVRSTQDDFLAAAAALGQKEIVDLQDFGAADGWSRWLRYISPDGKRQDAAHRYIHPLMSSGKHPNLHLLLESKVRRVVFEGTRAVGVEYEPSAASQPATALSQPAAAVVRARQLVVVSAGAISTPGILERSGVGGAERLGALGIPVVSDLACVGEEYQDHNLLLYAYKTSLQPHETLDGFLSGRLDVAAAAAAGDAMLGWNGVDIAGKLRPTDEEVSQLGPEFRELWDRDFRDKPSRPLMLFAHLSGFFGDHKALDVATDGTTTQYTTIGTYTAYPYSRGSVHVTSKDVREPPSFRTGFLTHPADLTKLVWAYKKQRDLYRRTNAFAGELAIGHPKFRAGSRAALADGPLVEGGFRSIEDRMAVPPVEYDAEDDAAIEDWIRSTLNTTWHSLGTCKMAPRDRGGVVDRHLNVYGTEGLKIADLSMVPENVGANTNNTALIIGEKAAEIIGSELGLRV